jgi:hypothetical protein
LVRRKIPLRLPTLQTHNSLTDLAVDGTEDAPLYDSKIITRRTRNDAADCI